MFIQGPALVTRLLLLASLSIGLITLDHRTMHLDKVHATFSLLAVPFQYLVSAPISFVQQSQVFITNQRQLLAENAMYQQKQLILQAKILKLAALERENQRLHALLQSSSNVGELVLVAKLLQIDPDPFSHRVVLDKGGREGVYEGQPVLDADGVIGQIIQVGPLTSVALLITDVGHAVPVQDLRSGVLGIAIGTGSSGQLELQHVTMTADLEVGDVLVTSGLGGRFPSGYPVGVIMEIVTEPGEPFATVNVTPSAQLDKSLEVILVWSDDEVVEAPVNEDINYDITQ